MVSTAAIGKTAKSETKMPRRPAQLTQADIARAISAAKQAGASEAYTNNWNAVALI
jgi:DNA-binding XRE family transcriptional regulator